MRGAYTAGALSWLIDNNIKFDNAYGISTGAIHLCSFLLKNKKFLQDISTKYINHKKSIGIRALLKCKRIVDYDYLFDELLIKRVGFNFDELKKIKCNAYVGLYELEKGRCEYTKVQDLDKKLLQATTTLPLIGEVMEINNNRHVLDGGITEMIPINQAILDGCEKHLIITTKPAGYVRKPSKKIVVELMRKVYKDYPSVALDYAVRDRNYILQVDKISALSKEGSAVYIFPSQKSKVSRIKGKTKDLIKLYYLGYSDMENQKDKIIALFK